MFPMFHMSGIKRRLPLRGIAVAIAMGGLLAGCGGGGGEATVGVGVVAPVQEPAVVGLSLSLSRVGPEAVQVDWSDDPSVASFQVFRDEVGLATVTSTTSLVDASVIFDETYCYRVEGYDAVGRLIAATSTGCITIVP